MLMPDIACALPQSSDWPRLPLQPGRIQLVFPLIYSSLSFSPANYRIDDPIPATNWSVIEANIGLICACLPSLKPFLDKIVRTCLGQPPRNNTPNPYSRSKFSTARGYALGSISPTQGLAHRWDWGERGECVPRKEEPTDSQVSIMMRGHIESLWGIQKQIDVIIHRSEGAVMGHERSHSSFQ